jgi:nucleotide-binding universal stress UspA family protein
LSNGPGTPGLSALSRPDAVTDAGRVKAQGTLHPPPVHGARALTVLVDGCAVPVWLGDWCRHNGRQMRVQPAADALDRIRVIAALAGSSVLIPPSGLVAPQPEPWPVVAAVRDLPDDDAVLAEAASAARELDRPLTLAHVVPRSFAERSVRLDDAVARGQRVLDRGAERLAATAPNVSVSPRLLRRRPHELVGEELDAVLLVLGGPRPAFSARVGLVASSAVQHAHCPVLLVPRPPWPAYPSATR